MSVGGVNTTHLRSWLDRMRGGDWAARDDLLRAVGNRLERPAGKMLQRLPDVHRWADTGDALENSLMRLLRALQEVRPDSVRDFFGLVAAQMRRDLLDLARDFRWPQTPSPPKSVAITSAIAGPTLHQKRKGSSESTLRG
jgi:hypothetical protein